MCTLYVCMFTYCSGISAKILKVAPACHGDGFWFKKFGWARKWVYRACVQPSYVGQRSYWRVTTV